ncbi:MAG: apolipoprotein N-acyltransferase [Treponema sp.]|nr:apolipoprotein N-acyltransferase [Treponema sp.]
MNRFLQVFYILFSALMLALALPNEIFHFGQPLIGILSLVPLYIAFTRFSSYSEAALLTGLHTFTVHICSSYWLGFFKDFAALTLGASAVGTGVIGAIIGLTLYSPFARIKSNKILRIHSSPFYAQFIPFRALWFCIVYVVYEWIKSCGWFGYPWGTISTTVYRWKILIQIADITGTYGVTFLTCLFVSVLSEGYLLYLETGKFSKPFALFSYIKIFLFFIALFILTFIYGCIKYFKPEKPIKYLNTILIQQNADPWKEESDDETILTSQRLTKEQLEKLAATGERADIVVWSEGCLKHALPYSLSHYNRYPTDEPLIPFIRKTGVPFLLGGSYRMSQKPRRSINAALLFDNNGNFRGAYGKNHLVPLAEVLPFSDVPAVAQFFKKVIGISAGWTPGDQYVYFDIKGTAVDNAKKPAVKVISLADPYSEPYTKHIEEENKRPYVRISAPICFDDAFPDVCRPLVANGSELFMNITDDSWSLKASAEYQHFVVAAYRTIELRTTMARSTNSGYSVVITPKGDVIADMPLFEETATTVKIPVYKRRTTTYLLLGNWLPHLCALVAIAFEILMFIKRNETIETLSERKKFRKKKKSKKR